MAIELLKELFGDKPMSYDDLDKVATEKGLNIADLSKGEYVGKSKYDTDVNKYKGDYGTLKKQYDELAGAVDGDAGLKKQIETLKGERADIETKFNSATSELTELKNSQTVLGAGVNADMAKFVTFEVGKLVTDTMDFGTALKGYLAKNPQFKADGKTKVRTQPDMKGGDGAQTDSTVNGRMNDAILTAAGRK